MATLLIVDGSPMMHRIMELTFAPEGIQVIAETDGDQAIALLPVVRPDIVIADHALASRSGYDVAAFVSGHPDLGHIPVLLMASPFEPLDRARAETCGVAGEISKPFEPAQLVARVRALLAAPPREQPAAPSPEVRTPALKLVEPVAPSRGALDDYFDRLDAALERLDEQISAREAPDGAAPSGEPALRDEEPGLPTVDRLLGDERAAARGAILIDHPLRGAYAMNDEPDVPASGPVPDVSATPERGTDLSALVDALEALRRKPAGREPQPAAAGEAPGTDAPAARVPAIESGFALTEATIDEITRRVLERLAPGAVSPVVTDVITKVAERLLREEIARLKT